jgi:hypothetical protein
MHKSVEGMSCAVLGQYLHKWILLCITECYLGIGTYVLTILHILFHSMLFLPIVS